MAKFLAFEGFASSAKFYHAGMKARDRTDVQEWFLNSKDGIVVSTIAFGMGVNKSNIRYVYHYNLPKSLEGYAQVTFTLEIYSLMVDRKLEEQDVMENFLYVKPL